MKGFLAGVAATLLVVAVFPSVGRAVIAAPYALAAWTGMSWSGALAQGDGPMQRGAGRGQMAGQRGGGRMAPTTFVR